MSISGKCNGDECVSERAVSSNITARGATAASGFQNAVKDKDLLGEMLNTLSPCDMEDLGRRVNQKLRELANADSKIYWKPVIGKCFFEKDGIYERFLNITSYDEVQGDAQAIAIIISDNDFELHLNYRLHNVAGLKEISPEDMNKRVIEHLDTQFEKYDSSFNAATPYSDSDPNAST